jgi:glycerol-3-phosphate dehydrogenase
MTDEVPALISEDPSLAEPLPSADDYLRAEVTCAVTHEGARHLYDVLARRTRASIETWDRGVAAAEVVADLMAPVLGWAPEQVAREVAHYESRVRAERESQQQPDDATADAARLGAADIVPID